MCRICDAGLRRHTLHTKRKTPRTGSSGTGRVLLRRSFIFRMQKVRDAAQKQKAADDAGLHAEGAAF